MGDRLKALLDRFLEFWNKYTNKQKTLIISVAAGVVFVLGFLIYILTLTKYETLTSFETTKEASEAAGYLKEDGIEYKLSDDALTISVDKDKVAEARLVLGQNGVSDNLSDSYDKLFDTNFSTTDSQQKLKTKIYLQEALAASIKTIEGIKAAAVNITLPESTNSIYKNEEQPYASVMLTTNSDFSESSVEGIAAFVASSLGTNATDNVRIIDQTGKLLYSNVSGTGNTADSTAAIAVKDRVVDDMEASIRKLLINSGIYNDADVMANLDINLDNIEELKTEYFSNDDDDTGPLDSSYSYLAENVDGTGGVVGTDSNGEDITDYNLQDQGQGSSTVTVYRNQYSTSSTVTNTTKAIGQINTANSSVAIVLTKYKYYDEAIMDSNGELEGTTFEKFQAENGETQIIDVTDEVYSIVQQATGIKNNGIQIVAYEVPIFYPKESNVTATVTNILPIVLTVLIVGLLIFVVLRGMKPVEVTELEPELSVEALLATTKENQTLDDIEFSDKSATRQQIEKFVGENPEAVAQLLRNWLNDEWE